MMNSAQASGRLCPISASSLARILRWFGQMLDNLDSALFYRSSISSSEDPCLQIVSCTSAILHFVSMPSTQLPAGLIGGVVSYVLVPWAMVQQGSRSGRFWKLCLFL